MLTLLLALAAPAQTCTDTVRQCRACTGPGPWRVCSNIGIACQPRVRICRPAGQPAPKRQISATSRP